MNTLDKLQWPEGARCVTCGTAIDRVDGLLMCFRNGDVAPLHLSCAAVFRMHDQAFKREWQKTLRETTGPVLAVFTGDGLNLYALPAADAARV